MNEFRNYQQFSVNITNPAYPDPCGGRDPRSFVVSTPANIVVLANDYQQPASDQFNAGVSQRLTADLAVHVDAVYTHVEEDRKIQDINPRDPASRLRPNATFGRVDRCTNRPGDVQYQALYVKLDKRFSHRTQFLVSRTFAHSDDNAPLVRYIDPFNPGLDFGPSNGERRSALVASGAFLAHSGYYARRRLESAITASVEHDGGEDLNRDGFNTDLVPGTTRNSGSRDLNLAAVNAWRAQNGLGAVDPSQIDSSRINIADVRASKTIAFRAGDAARSSSRRRFNVFNTTNLQAQFGGGRVTNALSPIFGSIQTARPGTQGELAAKIGW